MQGFTTDWYAQALTDGRLLGGLKLTFYVAIPTALFSTILGAMAALALTRYPMRFRFLLLIFVLMPFLIPKVILAVAQLILLADLGIGRSLWTIIAGQTIVILPFTTLVNASVLMRIDKRLEEAAFDLGASHFSAFKRVTLPLMKNGLMASWFIAFVLSSAEYVLTSFLSGREQPLSILVASDFVSTCLRPLMPSRSCWSLPILPSSALANSSAGDLRSNLERTISWLILTC